MPRSSSAREGVHSRIRQLAGSALPPEELARQILNAILLVVPADGAVILGIDPASFLINRLLGTVGTERDGALFWIRNIYLAREPIPEFTFSGLMSANVRVVSVRDKPEYCWGMAVSAISYMTPHQFYNAYHEVGTPAGGGLRAWFEADGQKIAALQMIRSDAAHPFEVADWQFLHRLSPVIGRALALALTREKGHSDPAGDPLAAGVVVLTPQGRITLQSPTSEKWLQLLSGHDAAASERSEVSGLPVAVWSAMAGLRATISSGAIHAAVRVPTQSGFLRVEASTAGDDGQIAVTLIPEQRPIPPELPASWHLTPQERKVLSLVVRGMTNREIAGALVVSENTVETHLKHAYEKLAVNSRTQFLARVFQEVCLPVL